MIILENRGYFTKNKKILIKSKGKVSRGVCDQVKVFLIPADKSIEKISHLLKGKPPEKVGRKTSSLSPTFRIWW